MEALTRRRPRKGLGQHWLVDARRLRRIADAANFSEEETVVEVGPGKGALTQILAGRAERLIAVEVDQELASVLRERFKGQPQITIAEGDVLSLSPAELLSHGKAGPPYVVVGNLPYFIGTAIVRHFLQSDLQPRWMVVMLQAEVAESMAAGPGRMTYLSLETQVFAKARVLFYVPPSAFKPPPKVRSAVVRLESLDHPRVEGGLRAAFLEFGQAGFAAPRKQVANSLAVGLQTTQAEARDLLEEAGIEPALRPANLSIEDWLRLFDVFQRRSPSPEG